MNHFHIYQVASHFTKILPLGSNHPIITFSSFRELKAYLVFKKPDLLIFYINDFDEFKLFQDYLLSLSLNVPVIVASDSLEKTEALNIIALGAIDYIDLNDSFAQTLLNESVEETLLFIEQKSLLRSTSANRLKHAKTLFFIGLFVVASVLFAWLFIP